MSTTPAPGSITDLFGEPIYTYSRSQALADGVLVALPQDLVAEAGFTWPVLLTAAVHADVVRWGEQEEQANPGACQDQTGRAWDVLWMTRCAIAAGGGATTPGQRVPVPMYRVPVRGSQEAQPVTLEVTVSVEAGQPALVLMFPHED